MAFYELEFYVFITFVGTCMTYMTTGVIILERNNCQNWKIALHLPFSLLHM